MNFFKREKGRAVVNARKLLMSLLTPRSSFHGMTFAAKKTFARRNGLFAFDKTSRLLPILGPNKLLTSARNQAIWIICLVLGLLVCAIPAHATWAIQQHKMSGQGAAGQTVTFSSAVGGSDQMICVVHEADFGSGTITCTDNAGAGGTNDLTCGATIRDSVSVNFGFAACCVSSSALANNPPTFTGHDPGGSNHELLDIRDYTGGSCTADGQTASSATSTANETSNSITTTATDLLISAFTNSANNSYTVNSPSPWTDGDVASGSDQFSNQDRLNVAAGAVNGAATYGVANATWGGAVFAFKSGGGAACTPTLTLLGVGRCG